MTTLRRDYDAQVDVVAGERAIVATINTDGLDRYKTVILPSGARLDNYRKNPVVLWNHGASATNIGRNLWIKVQRDRLIAKTQFLPEGVCPIADKVFQLYQLKFLNAWSVSFDPIEYGRPTPEEIRKRPDWAAAEVIYRAWDLLEYSAVTLPGNADCLTEACSRGLALPGWPEPTPQAKPAATPAATLPPLLGRSRSEVLESLGREIRRQARADFDRAMQDAQELARGMV